MSDNWKAGLQSQCCAKCNFLVRYPPTSGHEWRTDGPPFPKQIVPEGERPDLLVGNLLSCFDKNGKDYNFSYACWLGVWNSEKLNFEGMAAIPEILDEIKSARGRGCFYYEYTQGTSLAAAKVLERRKVERREARNDREEMRAQGEKDREAAREEARKNRRLMLVALIVSALMLIASVTYFFFSLRDGREPSAPEKSAPAPTTAPAKASDK